MSVRDRENGTEGQQIFNPQ